MLGVLAGGAIAEAQGAKAAGAAAARRPTVASAVVLGIATGAGAARPAVGTISAGETGAVGATGVEVAAATTTAAGAGAA